MDILSGLVFTDLLTKERVRVSAHEIEKIERIIVRREDSFFDYAFTLFDGRTIRVAESEISKYLYQKSSH